jgi:hypothetical protein
VPLLGFPATAISSFKSHNEPPPSTTIKEKAKAKAKPKPKKSQTLWLLPTHLCCPFHSW